MSKNKNHYFVGYKALGFISNELPIEVGYFKKRNEPYIITCVGKAFHTYTCPKLGITNISDSLSSDISVLKADEKFVYAASSTEIYIFIQFKKVIHILKSHKAPIRHLLPFGDHLISIDEEKNLKVWQSDIAEIYSETSLQFEVSCFLHPRHYNNKILLAYNNGTMQLYNINQSKVLYDFKGWSAPITALQQSQALDIVGVGLKDGHIHLHHLRNDQTLISFRQNWGAVTAITFRTDLEHVMLTGSESGHVAVWNLKDKRLLSQSMNLHEGPVTSLVTINNQSIVVTSSNDNTLKVWVSDNEDSALRLLNTRSGHSKPPCHINFHDQHTILSAGLDCTLRSFSCIHDSYNKSLGRCRLRKMKRKSKKNDDVDDDTPEDDVNLLSHVTRFVSQTARQSDWDGIVCCHDDQDVATTWNFNKKTLGKHHFRAIATDANKSDQNKKKKNKNRSDKYDRKTTATCVDISTCGNFAVVGFSNGLIFKFNMQSGLLRGCYGDDVSKHVGLVSGVFVDGLNRRMVSIGWDGCLKSWDFASRKLEEVVKINDTSLKLGILCRDNNLLAVAREDFVVDVVDINSLRTVRSFKQHRNDVTDMSYGRSGRWLLTACMDGCIRLFDLVSASLIDVIQTSSPPTSISLSPSNELLATTHVDQLGIYLWFNTCLYSKASENFVVGDAEVEIPKTKVDSSDEEEEEEENGATVSAVKGEEEEQVGSLVTLAQRGHLKVNSLLHYDLIKERNKPKEGLKKDEKAPFFLPTSLLKEPLFEVKQEEELKKEVQEDIPLLPTRLASMLQECQQHDFLSQKFENIEKYILSISTGLLDTELKFLLSDGATASNKNLNLFVSFLTFWLKSNKHADLANAIVLRMTELKPSALVSTELEGLLKSLEKQFSEIRRQHHTSQALLSFVSGNSHFFPLS